MRTARAIGLALAVALLVGCSELLNPRADGPTPAGRYAPPLVYADYWRQVQQCTGHTARSFVSVEFYHGAAADSLAIGYRHPAWIILGSSVSNIPNAVRHAMVWAMLDPWPADPKNAPEFQACASLVTVGVTVAGG